MRARRAETKTAAGIYQYATVALRVVSLTGRQVVKERHGIPAFLTQHLHKKPWSALWRSGELADAESKMSS